MAAASNGGKIESNRKEQQKYFTLSSALQLVCDELTAAEYTGKYFVETKIVDPVTTGEGENAVTTPGYNYKIYDQRPGEFACGLNENEEVLPLGPELDYLFSKKFDKPGGGSSQGDDIYRPLSSGISDPAEHSLTLTVQSGDDSGLTESVEITVRLGSGAADEYKIRLTAVLKEQPEYAMYAELDWDGPSMPQIGPSGEGENVCTAITWKVSQITRGEIS